LAEVAKKRAKARRRWRRNKPEVKTLSPAALKSILERAQRGEAVCEEDWANLEAAIDTLEWVTSELHDKTLTLARLRGVLGIPTSEKTRDILGEGEGTREDKAPSWAGDDRPQQGLDGVPGTDSGGKPRGHGRNGVDEYTGAQTVDVPHESLRPGDRCAECKKGKVYEQKDPCVLVRLEGQAPLVATVYRRERLRCNLCGKVFTAKTPEGVGEDKYDETAAAMIALLKYGSGLPFNRLERLEGSQGIPLPAATQWEVVAGAADKIAPVYEELVRQAAQGEVVHHDDTAVKILEYLKENEQRLEEDPKARTGMHTTGIVSALEDRQIAVFFTGRQHGGENIADLLAKRAAELEPPIKMADGLPLNEPKGIEAILANCLVHGRRKFVELVESFPEECRHVLEVLRDVYENDAVAREKELSPEERLRFHQENSKDLMDGLKAWMKDRLEEQLVEPNSTLGAAIRYMLKRWQKLTRFLEVAGAPLDNNIAERALKKVILHRKNALFFKTQKGAWVGDIYMSLIYTAEQAKANPFDYLTELQRHAEDVASNPARWLPWNYLEAMTETAGRAPP
jgi:hypothetical protein